jgi:hypothetical protein
MTEAFPSDKIIVVINACISLGVPMNETNYDGL